MPPFNVRGAAAVQLYVQYAEGTDLWGAATWGQSTWESETTGTVAKWDNISGKVLSYQLSWGADDPSGALTVSAAGSWECKIYDPKRELDPSNTVSRFAHAIKPGHPIRLRYLGAITDHPVRSGVIDEVEFDISSMVGTIRGTDSIQLMVAASMLPGQDTDPNMPTTLRAMAEYMIAKVGLDKLVVVERGVPNDPIVGKPASGSISLWAHISTAAYDVLHAAWIDRYGQLRFRSFGAPYDAGLSIGGADGIPVHTIKTSASIKNVYTRVVAYDSADPPVRYEATNPAAQEIFGDLLLERKKATPNPQEWVDAVLLDRAGAALQYASGTIYPVNEDQLLRLLDLNMVDVVHLVAETVSPSFDISVRILGGYLKVDAETGWTFELYNYIPANEWDELTDLEPPPVEPPDPTEPPVEPPVEPPPDQTQKVTRWYNAEKDTGIGITGSTKAGQGADDVLAIGAWQGWKFRTLIGFPTVPFGADIVSLDKASLEVTNSTQVTVGFGSSPKVTLRRITESWNEGASDVMHTSNATVWPGPASTSTGAKTSGTLSRTEGATYLLDCTEIIRAWRSGSVQRGIEARSYGEDNGTYTIEWVSSEGASADRPRLKVELTVKKPAE